MTPTARAEIRGGRGAPGALSFFTELRSQGAIASFVWQGRPARLLNEPSIIEHVLGDGRGNYLNPPHEYADLQPILTPAGRLLLGLHGRSPALAAAGEHSAARAEFERLLLQAGDDLCERLLPTVRPGAASEGLVPDALEPLKVSMLQFFTRLLFDVEVDDGAAIACQRAAAWLEIESVRQRAGAAPRPGVELAERQQLEFASLVLAQRLRQVGRPVAAATQEFGSSTRRAVIRTLLNGYNAMATTLAWTCVLLAAHPETQARLVSQARGTLPRRRPALRDVASLTEVRYAIQEAERLYPSAWLLGRTALRDESFGRWHVPAGALVYICPFALHRDPRFWQQPDAFLPLRFAAPGTARPRGTFLPFGSGPRRCPARSLSQAMLVLLLAALLARYQLREVPGTQVVPWPLISLRPHPSVPLRLLPR